MDETAKDDIHSGGCLCGAVRFELRGPLRPVVACHCRQCQQSHGNYAAYTRLPRAGLSFTADRGLTWFASSEKARRGFCGTCGASLFWDSLGSDEISVAAGCIDPPSGLKTVRHIFVESKGDYYELTDGLEQLPAGQGPARPL